MQYKQQNSADKLTARLFFIDLLESLAIFFVLSYHGSNYNWDFLQDSSLFLPYVRYFLRTILSCCVPLFFFVNGFLLFNRPFNLKKHVRKIIRLIILTAAWGIIDLFFLMFIRNEMLSAKDFFIGVWNCKQGWINHLWYMRALVVIYFLFPLLKTAFDNRRDIFMYFTVTAAIFTFGSVAVNIIVSIAAHLILGKTAIYSIDWFNGFSPSLGPNGYSFVYFCTGGIAFELLEKFNFLKKKRVCITIILASMLGLFVVGLTLSHITDQCWDVVWDGYNTVFTFINVVCIFSLCAQYKEKDSLFGKMIFTISSNTLGIYFIHGLFNQLLHPYVEEIAILSNIPGNILYTVILLLVSLGTVLIIKRIPVLKRLLI